MKLSEIIRKKRIATATLATLATVTPIYPQSVATVATVNVANTKSGWLDVANDSQPIDESVVVEIVSKPKPRPDRQEWKPDPCNRCIHLIRFAGGNVCLTNNGLRLLYGFSHEVPDDQGATCTSWQADRMVRTG